MKARLNEKEIFFTKGATLEHLIKKHMPDAEVVTLNGGVVSKGERGKLKISDGDRICLIKKWEIPTRKELEYLMVARHSPEVIDRIKKATIGIAGCGGLGTHAAISLARLGIGKLVIADCDVVEPSNLNRQFYFVSQIGEKKVLALKRILKKINPFLNIGAYSVRLNKTNITEIFRNVDVMIEAFDTKDAKAMLSNTFAAHYPDKPLILASGVAGYGPSNDITTRKIGKNIWVVGDLKSEAKIGNGLMSPRVGIAANHQANLALRLILGEK